VRRRRGSPRSVDDGQHVGERWCTTRPDTLDHVRRPKVDHHAAVGERLAQSLRVGVFDGDVAAAGHMFAGRPDRDRRGRSSTKAIRKSVSASDFSRRRSTPASRSVSTDPL